MDFKEIDLGEFGRNIFAKILKSTSTPGTYQDTIEECNHKGVQFTDESFPPEKKSLIYDWSDESDDIQDKVAEWAQFEWLRADQILELNDSEGVLSIFAGSISPHDI